MRNVGGFFLFVCQEVLMFWFVCLICFCAIASAGFVLAIEIHAVFGCEVPLPTPETDTVGRQGGDLIREGF